MEVRVLDSRSIRYSDRLPRNHFIANFDTRLGMGETAYTCVRVPDFEEVSTSSSTANLDYFSIKDRVNVFVQKSPDIDSVVGPATGARRGEAVRDNPVIRRPGLWFPSGRELGRPQSLSKRRNGL